MQSPTETATNRQVDPFADLVHAVRLSLQPSTSDNLPTIPADVINVAHQSLLQPSPTTSSAVSASSMARPATFTVEAEDCSGFLLQCSLYFEMQSQQFTNDRARVGFVISLLSGREVGSVTVAIRLHNNHLTVSLPQPLQRSFWSNRIRSVSS